MGQRWFISSAFFIVSFLNFSNSLYIDSLNSGSGNEIVPSKWDNEGNHLNFNQELGWKDSGEPKKTLIEETANEGREGNTKWLNVYTFDKLYNLTEKDWGPQNETKLIFINTEDHLKIYENEDEDDTDTQLHEENKNILNLLSPEGLLSQINYEGQSNGLERTKRQAENGRRRCRCRRKGRRNMVRRRRRRRRRRRNRVGQQQRPARRRRRRRRGRRPNGRRGRRRCVCRKKEEGDGEEEGEGEGEGKSDGEEPEVEEADGEEDGTTTEEMDENASEEPEAENEDEEEEGDDDDDDDDDDDEDDADEDEEEEDGDDDNGSGEGNGSKSPEGMSSLGGIPAYIVPYPNMVETPIAVMPAGGYPMANMPTRAVPMYKFPPHSTAGAVLLRKSISNKED